MSPDENAKTDSTAGVVRPLWDVIEVEALSGFRLRVRFEDGVHGEVDMSRFLNDRPVDGTVFAPLRDPHAFAQVRVEMGAVCWESGADLAPDVMYDEIRVHGRWIVT